jgi:hypothetical protein
MRGGFAETGRRRFREPENAIMKRYLLILACALNSYGAVSISKTNYHGWPNSYLMANETTEVIVVPGIGRVMQFRFVGENDGPFWENRAMDGKSPIPASKEWGNFGGDKSWPAPQADWPKVTPRAWPPPVAFDSMAVEARVEGDKLRLISAVDPDYGIRTERVIELDPNAPKMTIETTYFKSEGEPRKVAIWIITQLNEPTDVRVPLTDETYVKQSEDLPMGLRFEKDGLHLKRSPSKSTKIGTKASVLEWRDRRFTLSIESKRAAGAEYPDEGSSAEVYTNPNPLTYVELEMLGPLRDLKVGDSISQLNVYTLGRATNSTEDIGPQ